VVRARRLGRYRHHADAAVGVLSEFGALKAVEGWSSDVPEGVATSLRKAAKKREDETVVLG
jgi:uncharacterized protein YbaA (DUF1428 family)